MKNLTIFKHISPRNHLEDFEKFYINSLSSFSDVLLISNHPLSYEDSCWLTERSILSFCLPQGLESRRQIDEKSGLRLEGFNSVLLTDNSLYGPVTTFNHPEILLNGKDFFCWTSNVEDGKASYNTLLPGFLLLGRKASISGVVDEFLKFSSNSCSYTQSFRLVNFLKSKGFTSNLDKDGILSCPTRLDFFNLLPDKLIGQGVPFISKSAFLGVFNEKLADTFGSHTKNALEKANQAGYDCNLIYKDLLSAVQSRTFPNLPHFFILNSKNCESQGEAISNQKIALVIFVYFEELIEQNKKIINTFIELGSKILIVSPKSEILNRYRNYFKLRCSYELMPNRGRNEFAYFRCGREILSEYDFTCLLHDKKSSHERPAIRGEDWNKFCLRNLVGTKCYIRNVINQFNLHPEIGLLFPPPPVFSKWRRIHGSIWENPKNVEFADILFSRLKITAPFDQNPLVPFGAMFWVRKNALSKLINPPLPDSFFPPEPLPPDGSILHALERIYSMIGQDCGYYSGWILSMEDAERYILNLFHLYNFETIIKEDSAEVGIKSSFRMLTHAIKRRLKYLIINK